MDSFLFLIDIQSTHSKGGNCIILSFYCVW